MIRKNYSSVGTTFKISSKLLLSEPDYIRLTSEFCSTYWKWCKPFWERKIFQKIYYCFFFLAYHHIEWVNNWAETVKNVQDKVHADYPTHAYITSIDDIKNAYKEYNWYKTDMNPVKPVSFKTRSEKQSENLSYLMD